jgi:hypothetical protein
MLTKELFESYIEHLGHRPACAQIDIPKIKIDYHTGRRIFQFYVNQHNLCWYSPEEKEYGYDAHEYGKFFTLTIRDFKLFEIGI